MQHNSTTPTEPSQLEISPISPSDDWKPGTGMITVRTVETNRITPDPAFQMRSQGTDPVVVEKYAGIMKESDPDGWAQFPLIRVFAPGKLDGIEEELYKIVSGFHRFAAIQQNGYEEIQVELMYGDETEALVASLGQNADRSQPRTLADIASMMEFCLTHPEISLWSNNQIAQWCAVSPQTVNNHENRLLSESSISKLEIEKRPNRLKFMDRHGNVSMRQRTIVKNEGKLGRGECLDGGIHPDVAETEQAIDAEAVERQQLETDISSIYLNKIRSFMFDNDPLIYNQRRAELLEEYPILVKFQNLQDLTIEDLRQLHEGIEKIADELQKRKGDLRDECHKIYQENIWRAFPSSQTTHEEDQKWKAALEADFSGFVQYQSIWSLSYWELTALKATIEQIVEHLKTNGIDAYLPASYTERKQAENAGKKEGTKKEKEARAVDDLRDEIEALVIDIVDPEDDLQWSLQKAAVSMIRSHFNSAVPDASLSKEEAMEDWDDMAKRTLKHIRRVKGYWQQIKAGIEAAPQPQWVVDGLYQFECKQSGFEILAKRGWAEIGKTFEILPSSPLSEAEQQEIVKAAHDAAKEKAQDIHLRHICGTDGKEHHHEETETPLQE